MTDNPYGVIYIECANFKPHGKHTWREGFLWHRKRECSGRPHRDDIDGPLMSPDYIDPSYMSPGFGKLEASVPLTIVEHKHDFKLVEGFTVGPDHFIRKPDSDLLWECDWLDCRHLFVIDRNLWHEQGAPYDAY